MRHLLRAVCVSVEVNKWVEKDSVFRNLFLLVMGANDLCGYDISWFLFVVVRLFGFAIGI